MNTRRLALLSLVSSALACVIAAGGPPNPSLAQEPARELLNSERIAGRFGSYGIEVLEASGQERLSNLYSVEGGERTCRTFAVVVYPANVASVVAAEHATIVAGGSIGAVFAANGWEVRKSHLYYGERVASARLAALMRVPEGTGLAEHAYVLDVVKDGLQVEYAALLEIHHPAYLELGDLAAIYGEAESRGREPLLTRLLATATAAVARPD